ncbi:glutaredoxin [Aerococcaceae bacterium zg-ZJ1578]|uniref:glutaredoxin n=1 Tax=Aerococcaceae bacterium zg-252 TaxID=2796928 RepID=UPI001A21D5A9|nr:glutaredoxin [Aerococcaceae bacterium zg-1578]
MTKPILYFSDTCPDTAPFVTMLQELGVVYDEVNITSSIPNLKHFLSLRDTREEFDAKKALNQVGIPVLVTEEAQLIFDETTLRERYDEV